eukprot:25351_1
MVRLHRSAMMAALSWKAFSLSFTSFTRTWDLVTRTRVSTPLLIGSHSKRDCRLNRGGSVSLHAAVDLGGAGIFLASWQGLADATSVIISPDSIQGAADAIQVANTATSVITHGGGWFDWIVSITEGSIIGIAEAFRELGIPGSYGTAIIAFTVFIKGLTFPLTYQQLNLSNKLQALQTKVKEVQDTPGYSEYEKGKVVANLYSKSGVNPLSGFLPVLVQIPIFIAFYRALMALAKDGRINEPFLWLPSLQGPTFGAPAAETLNWIKQWHAGVPLLGWHDTLCYLSVPILLVMSQYVSQQLMQPPRNHNEPETSQITLKLIPLVIGWFSLNMPSGLGLYWIVSNILTTLSSVFIRGQISASESDREQLYNEGGPLFSEPPFAESDADDV